MQGGRTVADHDALVWAHRPGKKDLLAGGEPDGDITRRAAVVVGDGTARRGDAGYVVSGQHSHVARAVVDDGQVTAVSTRRQGDGQENADEAPRREPCSPFMPSPCLCLIKRLPCLALPVRSREPANLGSPAFHTSIVLGGHCQGKCTAMSVL